MTHRTGTALAAAFLCASFAVAQDKKLSCDDSRSGDRHRVCEMRELNVANTGKLTVDASPNGGIKVKAWDQATVLVRARVEAWGDSDAESKSRLAEVHIDTAGAIVKASGPRERTLLRGEEQKWSVSYEAFVPRRMDLKMNSVNGGIGVDDVRGSLQFETVNGGIRLVGVNGTVKGQTVNGGIHIDLAGSQWDGDGLQVSTVNGGVTLNIPSTFNASVHASTTNGGMHSEFEGATVQGKWGPKTMDVKLGAGGPAVKVDTVNGGVHVRRKA